MLHDWAHTTSSWFQNSQGQWIPRKYLQIQLQLFSCTLSIPVGLFLTEHLFNGAPPRFNPCFWCPYHASCFTDLLSTAGDNSLLLPVLVFLVSWMQGKVWWPGNLSICTVYFGKTSGVLWVHGLCLWRCLVLRLKSTWFLTQCLKGKRCKMFMEGQVWNLNFNLKNISRKFDLFANFWVFSFDLFLASYKHSNLFFILSSLRYHDCMRFTYFFVFI